MNVIVKVGWEIACMRRAGGLLAEVREIIREAANPGTTTAELDALAEDEIRKRGALPAFKGYTAAGTMPPFPATICTSLNDAVVHGIPSDRALVEGDNLSIDFGLQHSGYFADTAFTQMVGGAKEPKLLSVTREALARGINQVRVGNRVGDIGYAIEKYAKKHGLGVVRQFGLLAQ